MGSNGIDVSNNNGELKLASFSGLDFVFAKASESTTFIDPTYNDYRQQAASLGVVFGAYHFAHPANKSAKNEAQVFCNAAKPASGMLFWIDYELPTNDYQSDGQWLTDFYNEVKTLFPHAKLGLYADETNMHGVARHATLFDAYWLALYDGKTDAPSDHVMPAGLSWNVHQYEVLDNVDRNYSRWTKQEMLAFAIWPTEDNGETAVQAEAENTAEVQQVDAAVAIVEQAVENPPPAENALTWEQQVTLAISGLQQRLSDLEKHVLGN